MLTRRTLALATILALPGAIAVADPACPLVPEGTAAALVTDLATLFDAGPGTAPLRHSPECILEVVAREMGVTLPPDLELPAIVRESQTSVERFRDAIEPQWGVRPDLVTNAYAHKCGLNVVFLIDEAGYYERTNRFLDDSLAHELAHFVQVRVQGHRLEDDIGGDFFEPQAVSLQTWFRDTYLRPGVDPCAGSTKK